MEGQRCCCPLPFAYFPHGKSIQVVADGVGMIPLPGLKLVDLPGEYQNKAILYLSCWRSAKKDEATEGERVGGGVPIPHFPKLINLISSIGIIAQVIFQCLVVRLPEIQAQILNPSSAQFELSEVSCTSPNHQDKWTFLVQLWKRKIHQFFIKLSRFSDYGSEKNNLSKCRNMKGSIKFVLLDPKGPMPRNSESHTS